MMKKDSMRMTTAQFAKLHEVNKRTLLCDADNDPDQGLVFINNECYITCRTMKQVVRRSCYEYK